jgi:hypothetical protein
LRSFANQPDIMQIAGQAAQMRRYSLADKMQQAQYDEYLKKKKEEDAMRAAAAGAIVPGSTGQVSSPGVSLSGYAAPVNVSDGSNGPQQSVSLPTSGVQLPGMNDSLSTAPSFDRNKYLSNVAGNPAIAGQFPQIQAQMAQQDQQMNEILQKVKMGQIQLDNAKADNLIKHADIVARLSAPLAYMEENGGTPQQLAGEYARVLGIAQQQGMDVSGLPPQYVPGLGKRYQVQALGVKDAVETNLKAQQQGEVVRHNKATETQSSATLSETKRHNQASEESANAAPVGLTDAAISQAANLYSQTALLPAMGMGKGAAGLKTQVMNRAASLNPATDLASNKAVYGANTASLKQVVGMKNAVEAYENTAGKNLDLFIEQAKNVPDTGIPILNAPARALAEKMGNDKVSAYNAARQVALTEISRVVNNPNLTGQLSDSARTEVSSFNPQSATLAQTLHIAKVLRADMKNRHDSLLEQEKAIRSQIGSGTGNSGSPSPESSHPFFGSLGGTVVK